MAGRETTPLLQKKGDNKTYYFKKIEKKGSSFQATSDGDGGRVVETLPVGSTEEDFAPRTLGASSKVSHRNRVEELDGKYQRDSFGSVCYSTRRTMRFVTILRSFFECPMPLAGGY
mmetsp:Transcript_30223/g.64809  ORF Transcript_30223/g.64809 Transcript_30223/m.64809 type:complete len:116 (-) Transcript_30223:1995-2342(-)